MTTRWWFWRGPIEADAHARSVLDFAAVVFALMAATDLSGLWGELTTSRLMNMALFAGAALLLKLIASRIAAFVLLAYCGFISLCVGLRGAILFTREDLTYLWALLFLAIYGLCAAAAWRAYIAANVLHRRPPAQMPAPGPRQP